MRISLLRCVGITITATTCLLISISTSIVSAKNNVPDQGNVESLSIDEIISVGNDIAGNYGREGSQNSWMAIALNLKPYFEKHKHDLDYTRIFHEVKNKINHPALRVTILDWARITCRKMTPQEFEVGLSVLCQILDDKQDDGFLRAFVADHICWISRSRIIMNLQTDPQIHEKFRHREKLSKILEGGIPQQFVPNIELMRASAERLLKILADPTEDPDVLRRTVRSLAKYAKDGFPGKEEIGNSLKTSFAMRDDYPKAVQIQLARSLLYTLGDSSIVPELKAMQERTDDILFKKQIETLIKFAEGRTGDLF